MHICNVTLREISFYIDLMAALLEGHISVISVTDGHKFSLKMLKQRTIKCFTGVQKDTW